MDVLVIHGISLPPRRYGNNHIAQLFRNRLNPDDHDYFRDIHTLKVSAHFLIDRWGRITQFVSTNARAWHAGESCFNSRKQVNDFSIGIELEGCDEHLFDELQYEALSQLTRCLLVAYPAILKKNIVGHSDIAPERKTDPGPGFCWERFRRSLGDIA